MTQQTPGAEQPSATSGTTATFVEPVVAPPAPNEKVYSEADVAEMIKARVARIKGGEEADARFAELEKTAKETQALLKKEADARAAAEKRAIDAQVSGLLTGFHDGAEKFLNLEGVTVDNVAEKVGPQLEALRTEKAYLVKAAEGTTEQTKQPQTPGANAGGATGLISKEHLATMKPEDLAKDPEKFKLYIESLEALENQK